MSLINIGSRPASSGNVAAAYVSLENLTMAVPEARQQQKLENLYNKQPSQRGRGVLCAPSIKGWPAREHVRGDTIYNKLARISAQAHQAVRAGASLPAASFEAAHNVMFLSRFCSHQTASS